jgi:hypothetical protein
MTPQMLAMLLESLPFFNPQPVKAAPQDSGTVSQPSLSPAEPVGAAPVKRKPGRPRKS